MSEEPKKPTFIEALKKIGPLKPLPTVKEWLHSGGWYNAVQNEYEDYMKKEKE